MLITGIILGTAFSRSHLRKKAIKPVLHEPNDFSPTVSGKLLKRYHFVPSNEDILAEVNLNSKLQTINPQEAAPSSSVASQRFHDNFQVTENTKSQQEGQYVTVEKTTPCLIPLND